MKLVLKILKRKLKETCGAVGKFKAHQCCQTNSTVSNFKFMYFIITNIVVDVSDDRDRVRIEDMMQKDLQEHGESNYLWPF